MTELFDFKQFPVLTTDRLVLRQLTHANANTMIALFSSPEVLRFLNQDPVDTHEKAINLINFLNGGYDAGENVQWAITLAHNAQMIGNCGNYAWDRDDRRADIGYHVLPAHWGKGYATEAAHAILRWSFDNFNLHRVQADCTAGNDASERVMIKCGFTLEGVWRQHCWEHGRFVDIKQYGLLRHEYDT